MQPGCQTHGACDHGAECKAEVSACHAQGAGGGASLAGSLVLRIINVGYLPRVHLDPAPQRGVDRQLQLQGQLQGQLQSEQPSQHF